MVTDPIADFATRIRNAIQAGKKYLVSPSSKMREGIASVLLNSGFINEYELVDGDTPQKNIKVKLRYTHGKSAIVKIDRVSTPGLRKYAGYKEIEEVLNGLGIAIISTSKGIMSDKEARKNAIGGEVLLTVF